MTSCSALIPYRFHAVRAVRIAAERVIAVTLASVALSASAQTAPGPIPAPRERITVEVAFARADTNHDGRLSKEEAARLPAIADKFDMLDRDKDQLLKPEEFAVGFNAPV